MDKPAGSKIKREDYWRLGPVYIRKRLALLLLMGGCIGVLAVCGLPSGLFFTHGGEPPSYRYTDRRLMELSGEVRITDDSGTVRYEGEISQGAYTGAGRVYDSEGQLIYIGPLVNGVYEGPEARVYDGGLLVYEGEMAGGRYEGQGRRSDADSGVVSEGQFSSGVFQGEGRQFGPDGALIRAGTFVGELLNGPGEEYGRTGVLLRSGTFSGGLLHGSGVQYTDDGRLWYEGEFQNGLFHGQGVLYNVLLGRRCYEGEFVQGQPVGMGRIYHPGGQLLYEGNVYDGAPRAEAFLGLSLAEVEEAFTEHWLLYSGSGVTAFVYPYFHLMFLTRDPVELISPAEQEARAERERRELLEALAPPEDGTAGGEELPPEENKGDWMLSAEQERADIRITEVLSWGAPLAGTIQPETELPSGRRAYGAWEQFSDFAAGQPPSEAAAFQAGPFVYTFIPLPQEEQMRINYYQAEGGGVRAVTVLREGKDDPFWYQSAEREGDGG